MRRIVIWAMSTLTVLVLLFSYSTSRSSTLAASAETRQVTTASKQSGDSTSSGAGTTQEPATDGTTDSTTDGTTDTTSGTTGSGSAAAQTYDGDAYGTRYGDVQVRISVAGGKITAVEVLQVPMSDRHDQMINSQAVPVYNSEAVQAQSAQIDVVSGATVTWEGYTQSLQSAIDKANL